MALTDDNNGGMSTMMLMQPAGNYGGVVPYPVYQQGNGGGAFGGEQSWWIILLVIILMAAFGGWNNGGNQQGCGGGQPVIIQEGGGQGGSVQRGFDQAAIMGGIGEINAGINGVQQQLCGGFAGVNATINGGVNAIQQQLYADTIAQLERSYAAQTAQGQQMNALQAQFAQCCCDNRLATEGLKATSVQNTRDIIDNNTRNTQSILDKLCQLEIDGIRGELEQARRDNLSLQNQLNMAEMRASQTAQTAEIRTNNATVANQLISELRACPIPAQPVYGSQPIFSCGGNGNGGCGCGGI